VAMQVASCPFGTLSQPT
jgi:hypothetical protein